MNILHHYNCKINNSMKKVSLLLLTMLLTIGCNQKTKEQEDVQESKPQLTIAEKRNQEIQDSLNQIRTDSLSLIAWGDAKFGMSMKEVLATESFKNGYKYSSKDFNSISMDFDKLWKLKEIFNLNLSVDRLKAYFQEDELTKIEIESNELTADKIKELVVDCDILIKNFTDKYGSPSYQCSRVNILNFEAGTVFTYARFRIGSKSITIKLGERSSGYKYYYIIYIENDKFPKKRHIQTEKEKSEEQKRMEEAEKIKNNSF